MFSVNVRCKKVETPNIVSFETAQDVRDFGNPPSWLKQISIRSADGGDFKRATTSEYSDLGTNQPSGMYVTDSTGAGWERVSPKDSADPIWFGAVGTASPSDITSNNVAVQLAIDSTKHVTVPRGVWYDWQSITMPDQSRLIDNSGYDYRSGVGLEQAYTRTILKTNNDTGFTNGNTEWLTADYHPAHIVQTFAPVQTDGCRASFISYIGSALNDTLHATQWTFEYVDASPLVTVTGYDNGVLPHVATKLHTIRHPVDAEDAGAHGFYGKPSVGYTYERFMAGLTTIASYFTKNFIGSDTLPGASTGHFIKLYKKGANVIGRMRVKDEEIELLTKNNWSLKLKNDGQVASLNGLNPGFKTTVVNAADYDNGTMVYAYWLNPPKPLFAVAGNWYDANGVVV